MHKPKYSLIHWPRGRPGAPFRVPWESHGPPIGSPRTPKKIFRQHLSPEYLFGCAFGRPGAPFGSLVCPRGTLGSPLGAPTTSLHCTTPDHNSLHFNPLQSNTPHHTTPHCTTLHYTTLHYTTPHLGVKYLRQSVNQQVALFCT